MKIVLIGFMGSGKTTVAQKLGTLLKLPVLEMDELVFQKTNTKSMHEVFAKGGELLLRETEIAIAQEVASSDNIVISTGGGIILNKIIIDYFKRTEAKIFFLNGSFETIFARLGKDNLRPLFKNNVEAENLYHFRQPLYKKYADEIVNVDIKSVEEIAHEIAEKLS